MMEYILFIENKLSKYWTHIYIMQFYELRNKAFLETIVTEGIKYM